MLKAAPIFLLLAYGVVLAVGQLFFKISSRKIDHIDLFSSDFIGKLVTQPYFLLACFVYGLCTLVWVGILARINLSIAYPFAISTSILTTSLMGLFVFREQIGWQTVIAYALIGCALVLLSKDIF
mgnify:CR=1 FL=1